MFTEGTLRIEVHRHGKVTVLDVQSDRALIGSGAHCDVRLAPDEAAIEQVAVEALDEQVHGRSLALDRPCLLNGAPFIEGRIPPNAMLEVGAAMVCFSFVPRALGNDKRAGQARTPPVVQALALVGLSLGFYYVLGRPRLDPSAIGRTVVSPPALVIVEEACPQTDPDAARALAEQALAGAESRRERAPFYAGDGLQAVKMFQDAKNCFIRAGEPHLAEEARAAAEELRTRLSDELHVRHVRLERMLSARQFGDAKREGQIIAAFVMDPTHAYSQWLSAVVREGELQAKQGGKK